MLYKIIWRQDISLRYISAPEKSLVKSKKHHKNDEKIYF